MLPPQVPDYPSANKQNKTTPEDHVYAEGKEGFHLVHQEFGEKEIPHPQTMVRLGWHNNNSHQLTTTTTFRWVILFGWKGTVFPRIFSRLLVLILLSAGLNVLRHYEKWFPIIKPTAHTLVGMGLGLLLVYRTNASYDRYWEGRKLWYVTYI